MLIEAVTLIIDKLRFSPHRDQDEPQLLSTWAPLTKSRMRDFRSYPGGPLGDSEERSP
jgi:hypothetical protein